MPIKIYAGKRKSGAKREYVIPSQVHGPQGSIIWKEWELKNSFRESQPAKLFDAHGRQMNVRRGGVIYNAHGRAINSSILESFTRKEVLRAIAGERIKQKKFQWVDRRTRDAGKVLTRITTLKRDNEMEAMRMIAENPLFKVGIYKGELKIPENASLARIHALAEDYFFRQFSQANKSRKAEFERATGKIAGFAKKPVGKK